MNYSTMAQETKEPPPREIRIRVRRILGAAAFALMTAQSITFNHQVDAATARLRLSVSTRTGPSCAVRSPW